MIGERELRRVLGSRLDLTDKQLDLFLDNLRTQDQSQMFRRFSISEVEQSLNQISPPTYTCQSVTLPQQQSFADTQ